MKRLAKIIEVDFASMDEIEESLIAWAGREISACTVVIDLEEARTGTIKPNFVWNGHSSKPPEFIAWANEVFSIVATRVKTAILYCYVHSSGQTETWIHEPDLRPRRIKRGLEPCRNLASALTVALISGRATDTAGLAT